MKIILTSQTAKRILTDKLIKEAVKFTLLSSTSARREARLADSVSQASFLLEARVPAAQDGAETNPVSLWSLSESPREGLQTLTLLPCHHQASSVSSGPWSTPIKLSPRPWHSVSRWAQSRSLRSTWARAPSRWGGGGELSTTGGTTPHRLGPRNSLENERGGEMDAGTERKWTGICEEETPKVREKEETGRTTVPADGKERAMEISGSLFSYGCHGLPVPQPFAGATNRTLQQGDGGSSEARPTGAGLPVCKRCTLSRWLLESASSSLSS
ncbi:uncharacterized protein LOC121104041 [Ursus maritimus]|uniref:Uncharacterized protein LOC121104041 n=1 Tax=Ursus maritimus TaxID=29073 RepID=A0A8M1GKS2_URSMA|nr:uncharacterized protein LOC121104041 [Ursus maritimus]